MTMNIFVGNKWQTYNKVVSQLLFRKVNAFIIYIFFLVHILQSKKLNK